MRQFCTATAFLLALFFSACPAQKEPHIDSSRSAELAAAKERLISKGFPMLGISDPRVIAAVRAVRREAFCLPQHEGEAYDDNPLPIGHGQTISQPSLVAYMTQALDPQPGEKVLEIGTGSGYQTAILAEMGARVFSIEIIPELAERAAKTLKAEGYESVAVRTGDGYKGWPEEAPFDAIIVTAAPPTVPQALLDQLRPGGGRLLVPVGPQSGLGQELRLYEKDAKGKVRFENLLPVRFVPMVEGRPWPGDEE